MRKAVITLACCAAFAIAAAAQGMGGGGGGQAAQGPPSPVSDVQRSYTSVSNNVIASAEAVPEDKYNWTPPVPAQPDGATIRSWSALVAHMTDDANSSCFALSGGTGPAPAGVERGTPAPSAKSKADSVAGLKAALDLCTKASQAITTANMAEPSGARGNTSKLGQLAAYVAHANEHYGNMVTYLRLLAIVPPSSAGRGNRAGGAPGGAPGGGAMGR